MGLLENVSELLFGDRQGYLPSDTLFDIFLERIMRDTLEVHKVVSVGGRIFINFRLVDDIAANDEEEEGAGDIATSMDTTCTRYKT